MRKLFVTVVVFSLLFFSSQCKKEEEPACVKNFLGTYTCHIEVTGSTGSSGSGGEIVNIRANSGCQILLDNLSGFQVLASVSDDSFFVASQPFGSNSISGKGIVYLNQLSFSGNISNGDTYTVVGSK